MQKLEGFSIGSIGATLAAHKLQILIVLVAILIILLVVVVIVARKRNQPATGASAAGAPPAPAPKVDTGVLEAAWNRFLLALPGPYRRSILNFEQFVVMGLPASGKTRLIDSYSDWKQQTREFATTQANDPDLPVYLGSNELIMELPATALDDQSETAFQSLNRLWRPIYEERGPTVICVVDVARLMASPQHTIVDLAQKFRGKINLLSEIRKRPIEVRVALTHMDEIEGFEDLSDYCRDHEISLQVPPPTTIEQGAIGRGFDAWFDELRGYLPNTLTALESARFKRVVAFMSAAPDISTAVRPFLKALFQHEAAGPEPIYGGTYLTSESAGASNPLVNALETGPGPDPKRGHIIVASALGLLGVGFLADRFNVQHTRWSAANEALERYDVSDKSEDEPFRRAAVTAFTSKDHGWFSHHPDFFAHPRMEMRKRFAERIRRHYLLRGLNAVSETGTIRTNGVPMAARRTIYYLGLIHSDKTDKLHILDPGQTEVWASMIELRRDLNFLNDYLSNVDEPWTTPVEFQLANQGIDPADGSHDWVELFDVIDRALADGVIDRAELTDLQKRSKLLRPRLDRFDNDMTMRHALHSIDAAAGTELVVDGEVKHPGPIEQVYESRLDPFEHQIAWANNPDLIRTLRRVLNLVNTAAIETSTPRTLGEFVFRLEQLYGTDATATSTDESQISVVNLENNERKLPTGRWERIIRDSKAKQIVEGFLSSPIDETTLFGPNATTLVPVRWNPNGDGAAVFVGHGVLEGRYTKVAYDTFVRDVVVRLHNVLARANLSNDLRSAITLVVGDQISRYAIRYREEGMRFSQSFDVQAASQEALRVALAQMSADTSAFNDFLVALDQNTKLDAPVPLLAPIKTEMAAFDSWHQAVSGVGGAPEIGKYKAILSQLLVDLGPPAGVTPDPVDTGTETLEKLLSPVGRIYLAVLRGEKGSYEVLVENWLTSIRMPEVQRKAFRAPMRRLAELGRHDIERVIARMWHVDMLPALQKVASRFPFDRATTNEITPDEMKELFNPKDGRIFDLFKRYVEPVSQISGTTGFRPLPSAAQNLQLPAGLYTAINASAALSSRLWDGAGHPKPIEQKISTVRFDRRAQPKEGEAGRNNVLTLMFLNLGEASVFNFNQQPSLVTVGFEWTKDSRSQVGIQLTDSQTKESAFPSPIVSRGTYWSFYHLLLRAKPGAVRYPPGAQLYTWDVWSQPDTGSGEMIPVRFVMVNDPWEPFAGISHFAPRHKEPPKDPRRSGPAQIPPQLLEPTRGTM